MAAFPFQQTNHPLFLDSVFYSNPANNNNSSSYFLPQFYQLENPQGGMMSMDFSVHESSCSLEEHDGGSKIISPSHNNNNNETSSVTNNKQSPAASSSLVQPESGEQVSQKLLVHPNDKKRKYKNNASSLNSAQSKNTGEEGVKKNKIGSKKQKKGNNGEDDKKGKGNKKGVDQEAGHPPPTGYIHVRARRGQATDSHSLAERVRREKISERMKLLQAIVPGCDKVTGKALMLDEIINYVQSLQNQVEFLSMKLASVNPMFYDFGVDFDAFMVKPESLSSLEPQVMRNIQECSPTGSGNTFTTPDHHNYPLVGSSASASGSVLVQQAAGHQIPNILSQGNGQVLWGVMDDQTQKLINHSTLSNNLCSFH